MKFKEILGFGAKLAGKVHPGVGAAISAVNAFLPDDKKLSNSATVQDLNNTVDKLPPDVKAQLFEKEIDYKINESNNHKEIQIALADADSKGASTRPFIAKMMAIYYVAITTPVNITLCYVIAKNPDQLQNLWPIMLTILGLAIWVVKAYFGQRTEEKKARYAVAHSQPIPGDKGIIDTIKRIFN